MNALKDCISELKALRVKYGTSIYDHSVKAINRERLQVSDRPARIRLSPAKRKHLYFQQGGKCNVCGQLVEPDNFDIDHKNPNLTGEAFNAWPNLAIAHPSCNRSKGADSIPEQAKKLGETMVDRLR